MADQDGEQQSVDEEELKHMAGILVKDMPQSSCYYRFSNKQHQRVKCSTIRPENGVERGRFVDANETEEFFSVQFVTLGQAVSF